MKIALPEQNNHIYPMYVFRHFKFTILENRHLSLILFLFLYVCFVSKGSP